MISVLLVATDTIGPRMAGPGIRALELARALAAGELNTAVAGPIGSTPVSAGPPLHTYDPALPATLYPALQGVDVVISPPVAPAIVRVFLRDGRRWVVDLFNPEPFEGLEFQRGLSSWRRRAHDVTRTDRMVVAVEAGNTFCCSTERQRDMWLGFLAARRRVNAAVREGDPELRNLIDVVPFGVPSEPPDPGAGSVLRGSVFPRDARIALWHGGVWPWLDAATVLRAVARLRERDPRWVLAFHGTVRPRRDEPSAVNAAAGLARELGLEKAGAVHFTPGWTPYAERARLLMEADVGVSAHVPTLEAHFAARIRMLDYVWAGLPIVCTEGDEWAEEVRTEELGLTVPPGDTEAMADAFAAVAERGRASFAGAFKLAAESKTWAQACVELPKLIDEALTGPAGKVPLNARAPAARHRIAERVSRLLRLQ